jgi:acyl-CoA-dependent ceramide synthase
VEVFYQLDNPEPDWYVRPKPVVRPRYPFPWGNRSIFTRRPARHSWASVVNGVMLITSSSDLAFSLLALLGLTHHLIPDAQPHTTKFFTLSYYNRSSGKYSNGKDDVFLIMIFIVLFTGLRAAVMKYLLVPFAKMSGVRKNKDLTRFSEQSWMLCYYGISWTIGMVLTSVTSRIGLSSHARQWLTHGSSTSGIILRTGSTWMDSGPIGQRGT